MLADGEFTDFVLKFLHRFGSDPARAGRDRKPQKGKALSKESNPRLGGTQLETEPSQHLLDQDLGLFRLGAGRAEHDEIVSISNKLIAELVQLPIQTVQHNVGQQRGNDPSLRRAHRGGFKNTVFHHARLEKLLNES